MKASGPWAAMFDAYPNAVYWNGAWWRFVDGPPQTDPEPTPRVAGNRAKRPENRPRRS